MKEMKQHIPAVEVCVPHDFYPAARTPDNYVLCLWQQMMLFGFRYFTFNRDFIWGNLVTKTSSNCSCFFFKKTFQVKTLFSYLCSCLQDQGDLIIYHCDGRCLQVFHPPAFGYSATAAGPKKDWISVLEDPEDGHPPVVHQWLQNSPILFMRLQSEMFKCGIIVTQL